MAPKRAIIGDLRAIRQARNLFGSCRRVFKNGVPCCDGSGRFFFVATPSFGIEKVKAF